MKKGFILIEIMIGMVIAALLATGLLNTIMQVSRLQQTITGITSTYGRVALFDQQMERDIMGAFVPTQYDLLPTQTGKKEETKKKAPIDKIFYGVSKGNGGRLDYLTFITCNPLEIFFGIKDIKLKPRVARIVYRLIPDTQRKNSYVLLRQEGATDLAFDKYKEDAQGEYRAYEMIGGIQDFSARFISIEEKQDKDTKKFSYTYKKTPDWKDIDEKKQQEAKKGTQPPQRPRPKLPQYVELTISLWDSAYENYKEFVMTIPVESKYGQFEQPEKKKKTDQEEKSDQPDDLSSEVLTKEEASAESGKQEPKKPEKEVAKQAGKT